MHGGGALLRSLCALACVCVISTAAIGARVAEVTAVAGTAGVKRRHRGAALAESCPDQRGGWRGHAGHGSARARAATGGQSARNSSSITFRHQTSQVRLTTAISVARVRLTHVRVSASLGPRTRVLRAGSPRQGGSQKAPGCRERRRSRRRTRDRGRGEGSCARDGAGGDEKGGLDHRLGGLSEAARGA